MTGEKIGSLNEAIKEAIPHMQSIAQQNPFAELLVRAMQFSSGAQWIIPTPVHVEKFSWTDISANGVTDLGAALKLLASEMAIEKMGERALPPVLVLVSDGQPTDGWESGLAELMSQPWGKKAIRVSIAIGQDADEEVLKRFNGNPEIPVLHANNPDQLVQRIRWASTQVLQASIQPQSQPKGPAGAIVPVPVPPPDTTGPSSGADVW